MEVLLQSHGEQKGKYSKEAADQVPSSGRPANESAEDLSDRQKRRLAQREKKKRVAPKAVDLKPAAEAAKNKGGRDAKGSGKGKDKKGKRHSEGQGGYRSLPAHLQSQNRQWPSYQFWKGSRGGNRSGSRRWGKPPWN